MRGGRHRRAALDRRVRLRRARRRHLPPSRWSARGCTTTSTRPRTPEPSSCRRAGPAAKTLGRHDGQRPRTRGMTTRTPSSAASWPPPAPASEVAVPGRSPSTCDPGTRTRHRSTRVRCNTKICAIPCAEPPPSATPIRGQRLQGRRLRLRPDHRPRRRDRPDRRVRGVPGCVRGDPAEPDGRGLHGRPDREHGGRRPRGACRRPSSRHDARRDGPDDCTYVRLQDSPATRARRTTLLRHAAWPPPAVYDECHTGWQDWIADRLRTTPLTGGPTRDSPRRPRRSRLVRGARSALVPDVRLRHRALSTRRATARTSPRPVQECGAQYLPRPRRPQSKHSRRSRSAPARRHEGR